MIEAETARTCGYGPNQYDADSAEKNGEIGSKSESSNNADEIRDEATKDGEDDHMESEQHQQHVVSQRKGSQVSVEQGDKEVGNGIDIKSSVADNGNSGNEPESPPKDQAPQPDSDSDDFGSFSDASIEGDEIQDNSADIAKYLKQILPLDDSIPKESAHGAPSNLESLIQEERPRVIYEQLVLLRIVLKPFIWDKSCIKSNLWHILRIPEKTCGKTQEKGRKPLNDTFFAALLSMLHDDKIRSPAVLRDHFGLIYTPALRPVFLQEEDERQREEEVPELLALSLDEVENLQQYHDKLCQSIDLLLARFQDLQKRQNDLAKDKTTFENVVTNLTGHTQRLYRDEVALYNKHKQKRKNRFSWVGY